jgi:molybdopterin/thiamine biosynthesis adenylyltransferase
MPEIFDYKKAFARNIGLFSEAEQEKLRQCTVALPGLGGVGGAHLLTLTRMGIGGFHMADADQFCLANFNRQYGAAMSTLDSDKVAVMKKAALDINPELRLKTWDKFIDATNVEAFLTGCDLVIDCLDAFSIDARITVFGQARKMGIPVITAGPIGFSCSMILFTKDSMSFEDYFDVHGGMPEKKKFVHFLLGLTPNPYYLAYMNTQKANTNEKYGPSVASSIALCSGFAAVEAVKILLGRKKVNAAPHYFYFDPYLMKFKKGYLFFGNRNPVQRLKSWFIQKFVLK